ncbi:DNA binding domain protein, excisionase family [Leptospira interrogans str. 2003000735]|uniref:DNA binding domain protein, excisionase family n=2 Tax=Leptospira interrogans TaxID=173 RepID=A0A829D1W5_LEPIR|nr:excisionase family DNA-binding protein [Leptospira interrogans]EMY06252.1 DNA binding domain protein, excisionase family [Leptospira interrogans str. 2002000626]EMY25647.1 DNA binding domain protein, excisionase family [Leptospira interrogans serovar Australis str. 200703203]EKN89863.1 DNA binding domain protein, excisionase family [Leptospira interrogans str. 2002000624]EKQ40354.1 DNA binding domain protein, excisionase family [Leptospira interrogans str. 2002000621]EKQ46029.1 DNA binding 
MGSINGHTRNGSLLKLVQPSLTANGSDLTESQEILIPKDKRKSLTSKEAAAYLNLSIRSFNRHVIDHEIPFIEWGPRTRRFLTSDLDRISQTLKTTKQIY